MTPNLIPLPTRSLSYFSPFTPTVPSAENRLRKWLDDAFGTTEALGIAPAVEVAETPLEYTCMLELPGLAQKDVDIAFENGMLTIKGEKRDERDTTEPNTRYYVWERTYGAFQRSFTFPAKVDESKIAADMKQGVLTIHLPKAADEKAMARKIEVK
jgi:HSP20 family protein